MFNKGYPTWVRFRLLVLKVDLSDRGLQAAERNILKGTFHKILG